nr:aminoacyl-tRNA hydrolase [Oceanococcus sp. HetDA_MAG_MS8]
MLVISSSLSIPDSEISWEAIRAQGAGGQNVNKVSSAIHLRFDVQASSLPDGLKQALLNLRDRRVSSEGVVVIKAQRSRSQEANLEDARQRLAELVARAAHKPKARKATRPTRASQRRRVESKVKRGRTKALRRAPPTD